MKKRIEMCFLRDSKIEITGFCCERAKEFKNQKDGKNKRENFQSNYLNLFYRSYKWTEIIGRLEKLKKIKFLLRIRIEKFKSSLTLIIYLIVKPIQTLKTLWRNFTCFLKE